MIPMGIYTSLGIITCPRDLNRTQGLIPRGVYTP